MTTTRFRPRTILDHFRAACDFATAIEQANGTARAARFRRTARRYVYAKLMHRYGPDRVLRHARLIRGVLNRVEDAR